MRPTFPFTSFVRSPRFNAPILGAVAAVFSVTCAANPAVAQTKFWQNSAGGAWSTAANWIGGLPGSGDAAQNDFANALITFNTNATILSFLSQGAFTMNGGTLSGSLANSASTIQVNNTFTMNGGTLSNFTVNAGSGGQGITFTSSNNNAISGIIFNANALFVGNAYARVSSGGANTINSVFDMQQTNGAVAFEGTSLLTVSASGMVQGFGMFQNFGSDTGGTLTNNGTITANQTGKTLRLDATNITGSGTWSASNGGTLAIGGLLNLSSGSTFSTTGTGIVQIDGGGLSGTLSNTGGTGLSFSTSSGNYIKNATINGTATFVGNGFARVSGATNTLNGVFDMQQTNGAVAFEGTSLLTVSASGMVQGFGMFQNFGSDTGGTLTNNGTITANQTGKTLTFNVTNVKNAGFLTVSTGSTLVLGNGVGSGVTQTAGQTLANGTLNLNSKTLSLQGGSLNGSGSITGSGTVSNTGGTVDPGTATTAARLSLTGNYTQTSTGIFSSEIGGTVQGSQYDFFSVSGNAVLAGTLQVALINNFQPTVGQVFNVMSYGTHTGTFASGNAVTDTSGMYQFNVAYQSNGVFLTYAGIGSSSTPEPSALALIATALLPVGGIGAWRRRRHMASRSVVLQ